MSDLTHLSPDGRPAMVDVSAKAESARSAEAVGEIVMQRDALEAIASGGVAKGDVLRIAELAGVMAAKQTAGLIPLCHPIALTSVTVRASIDEQLPGVRVSATTGTTGRTGVEMEALTAVTIACLTIYDMAKALDRGMVIANVRLVSKSGGKSGDWKSD